MHKPQSIVLRKNKLAIAMAAAGGILAGAYLYAPAFANQSTDTSAGTAIEQSANNAVLGQLPGSFADLVETIKPAVVNISISGNTSESSKQRSMPNFQGRNSPEMEEFFKRFFDHTPRGNPSQPNNEFRSLGSGFIVDETGYVVTNNHVVGDAEEITVIMDNGDEFDAELVGTDKKTDLALLKVETDKSLPFVKFGDSTTSRIGDWVIAIGNPFGLGGTTTTGIISARGRDINAGPLDDFIQIDAPINRGNSGGPLFDTSGNVIGVNTAIYSPNGGSVGIGFAIPSEIVQNIVSQLKDNGVVSRGWLGVHIQSVSDEIAESLDLSETNGALVSSVVADSPAESAGLQAGDIILDFNGDEIEKLKDLPKIVANTPANTEVDIKVWRQGKNKTLHTTITSSGEEQQVLAQTDDTGDTKLGLALARLDQQERNRYRIEEEVSGVVIVDVKQGSPASKNGLQKGDVIVKVGDEHVDAPADVIKVVKRAKKDKDKAVLMLINREGQARFVAIRIT